MSLVLIMVDFIWHSGEKLSANKEEAAKFVIIWQIILRKIVTKMTLFTVANSDESRLM